MAATHAHAHSIDMNLHMYPSSYRNAMLSMYPCSVLAPPPLSLSYQCCARTRCLLVEPQPWKCYKSAKRRLKSLGLTLSLLPACVGAVEIEGKDPEGTVDRMVHCRGLTGMWSPCCRHHYGCCNCE